MGYLTRGRPSWGSWSARASPSQAPRGITISMIVITTVINC